MSIADKGSILYTVIARGDAVLAEYASATGNFPTITIDILKRLAKDSFTSKKASYSYDSSYHFHIMIESGLIYLCMADNIFAARRAFAYLVDIRNLFLSEYAGRWEYAVAHEMDRFSKVIEQRSTYFSKDANSDKLTALQLEIDMTKNRVTENIEKLIERGEHIDLLVERTGQLANESFQFKAKSTELKSRLWFRNVKIWFLIGCCILVAIFLVIWFACGFPTFKKCSADGGGGGGPVPSPGGNVTVAPTVAPTHAPTHSPTLAPTPQPT